MHRLFRKALNNATGESKSVIAVIIDIRDFSGFSQQCDSVDVATFVRKVYMKIIDEYFPFASFYKPTGDGLVITIPWDEKNLEEISQKVIASCIACHSEFGNICSGDPAINFKVPDEIGIGVARGSACCLVSGDKIIDYCGRLLNLAARLTDIARPSGIVVDGAFVIDLLEDEQQKIFKKEDGLYLKGVAESKPLCAYFTPEFTAISEYNKQPITTERWREVSKSWSYGELLKFPRPFAYVLPSQPLSDDCVQVTVEHKELINGEVSPKYRRRFGYGHFRYKSERGKPLVAVDMPKLCKELEKHGVREDMGIRVTVSYIGK